MRLGTLVKSGTYETLKWESQDSRFCLKVPNLPETRELVSALMRDRTPMATYFGANGHVQAWQWCLERWKHPTLYANARSVR